MFRGEAWTSRRRAPLLAALLVAVGIGAAVGFAASAAAADDDRRPLTEEEGALLAQAALAYADVEFVAGGTVYKGMPYLWGGRATVDQLLAAAEAFGEDEAVPALAGGAAAQPTDVLSGVGVDASGLVVNALRQLRPNVRFAAAAGPNRQWLSDATSSLLYHYNVVHIDPAELRAGDFVFFGSVAGDAVSVSGVGVVTGRSGTRVDFVVASARAGRVIHTFARTDGDYWRNHIVGAGRFLLAEAWPSPENNVD